MKWNEGGSGSILRTASSFRRSRSVPIDPPDGKNGRNFEEEEVSLKVIGTSYCAGHQLMAGGHSRAVGWGSLWELPSSSKRENSAAEGGGLSKFYEGNFGSDAGERESAKARRSVDF